MEGQGSEIGELPAVPHWNAAQIFLIIGGELQTTGSGQFGAGWSR